MTDAELRELLARIEELALQPLRELRILPGPRNNEVLVWALARIAGIAAATLEKPR